MSFAPDIVEEDIEDDPLEESASEITARALFQAVHQEAHTGGDNTKGTNDARQASETIQPIAGGGESRIPMPVHTLTTHTAPHARPTNIPHRIQIPEATTGQQQPSITASHVVPPNPHPASPSDSDPTQPPPPSMFNLLGILNNYRMRVKCGTLDNLFGKINLDARSWNLLVRSQLPRNELAMGLEQLLDTVTEFVKRLNRKSSSCISTLLDNVMYTEEVNFAYRVYSRSNTLFGQIFRYLKPRIAEIENYIDSERGQLPCINLKAMYKDIEDDLNQMYKELESAELLAQQERDAASKASSVAPSTAGSKRASEIHPSLSSNPTPLSSSTTPNTPGPASIPSRPSLNRTRSRTSSRRSSFKDDARKKAAIAASLAASAAIAAKAEAAHRSGTSTAQTSRAGSRRGSGAAATGGITPALQSPEKAGRGLPPQHHNTAHVHTDSWTSLHVRARSSSKGDASALAGVVASPTVGVVIVGGGSRSASLMASPVTVASASPLTPNDHIELGPAAIASAIGPHGTSTSAAALAAQALAAAAEAEAAAQALKAQGDDSEEDDIAPAGMHAGDDIFSKLLSSVQTHQYPLPPRLRKRAVQKPHPEFLTNYMTQHAKSFQLFESLLDCYLLCLLCALVALALTETLQKRDLYASILSEVNTLASHFVTVGLPLTDRLMRIEPRLMEENILDLSFVGIERGLAYSDARQCIRKCRLLHALFASMDIFIFPRVIRAHKQGTKCIASSHITSEEFVLTAGYDQALRIWDLRRNKCLAQFIGHTSIVTWCAFSAADTWLASASFDGTIKIWNSRTGECLRTLTGHADAILDGDIGGKDKHIVSAGMDCSVRLWAAATGKCIRIFTGHRHWVKSVRFAHEGASVLSAGLDNRIFIWALRSAGGTGGPKHTLAHANYVLDLLVLSPHRFLSTSKDETICAWDTRTGKQELELANPSRSTALTLSLSPDGSLIAAGFFDNTINVYEACQNCQLLRQIKVHNDGILKVHWINNRTIAVGTATGNVQVLHI